MVFRILFAADTHLGYAAKCRSHTSGLNQRVVDGYKAWRETVTAAIDLDVDVVIHGGDLFHRSWPAVSDIVFANQQLDRLSAAGIPVVGTTGNHDAAAQRGNSPATAAVHNPGKGVEFVTEPMRVLRPVEGLSVHVLSHYALARSERVLPEPVEGDVNILVGHGAARVPDHPVFQCADSPGELPIGMDVLASDWAVSLLGHYHGRGKLPAIGRDGVGEAWYAGSALRRGFSDPAGGRGALLVEIHPDGSVVVGEIDVWQRPQFDLPVIDAAGLTGAEVHEAVLANLGSCDLDGAIVRQVVNNVTAAGRSGLDLPSLASVASGALMWQPVLNRPAAVSGESGSSVAVSADSSVEEDGASLVTAGAADLGGAWKAWAPGWVDRCGLPASVTGVVVDGGAQILADVQAASSESEGKDVFAGSGPSDVGGVK